MKSILSAIIPSTVISISLALGACSGHRHGEEDHDHEAEEHAAEAHYHDHEDDDIVIEPDMARRLGIKVDTIMAAPSHESVKAAGSFISGNASVSTVSAAVSGTVRYPAGITVGSTVSAGSVVAHINPGKVEGGSTNAAALANLKATKAEMNRLKALYDEKLVTASEYNQAFAAYEAAKAAYSPAAASTVTAPASGTITAIDVASGQFVQAGTPLLQINRGGNLTLRVDVPASHYAMAREANDVNITLPGGVSTPLSAIGGHRISAAETSASAPAGFVPVYFSVPASAGIAPGTTSEVYLVGKACQDVAISVPNSALSEQQGSYFVYERTGGHSYKRLPVTIGCSDGIRTAITGGLKGGEVIVVSAVTSVHLAENSGAIPEGHNHNH